MNRFSKLCVVSVGLILAANIIQWGKSAEQVAPGGRQPALTTPEQRTSYALGITFGQQVKQELKRAAIVPESFAQGVLDMLRGQKPQLTQAEMKTILDEFQNRMQRVQATRKIQAKADSQKNTQAASVFLAANKKRPGVIALPSGLQYEVLRAGNGPSPAATNTVRVHYHGTLLDGTVFDSSVQRKEPIEFPLNQVIRGWTEAVTKMKVGGKWRLFIPADLAYGDNPREGGPIGPGMLLIFEVELLDILK